MVLVFVSQSALSQSALTVLVLACLSFCIMAFLLHHLLGIVLFAYVAGKRFMLGMLYHIILVIVVTLLFHYITITLLQLATAIQSGSGAVGRQIRGSRPTGPRAPNRDALAPDRVATAPHAVAPAPPVAARAQQGLHDQWHGGTPHRIHRTDNLVSRATLPLHTHPPQRSWQRFGAPALHTAPVAPSPSSSPQRAAGRHNSMYDTTPSSAYMSSLSSSLSYSRAVAPATANQAVQDPSGYQSVPIRTNPNARVAQRYWQTDASIQNEPSRSHSASLQAQNSRSVLVVESRSGVSPGQSGTLPTQTAESTNAVESLLWLCDQYRLTTTAQPLPIARAQNVTTRTNQTPNETSEPPSSTDMRSTRLHLQTSSTIDARIHTVTHARIQNLLPTRTKEVRPSPTDIQRHTAQGSDRLYSVTFRAISTQTDTDPAHSQQKSTSTIQNNTSQTTELHRSDKRSPVEGSYRLHTTPMSNANAPTGADPTHQSQNSVSTTQIGTAQQTNESHHHLLLALALHGLANRFTGGGSNALHSVLRAPVSYLQRVAWTPTTGLPIDCTQTFTEQAFAQIPFDALSSTITRTATTHLHTTRQIVSNPSYQHQHAHSARQLFTSVVRMVLYGIIGTIGVGSGIIGHIEQDGVSLHWHSTYWSACMPMDFVMGKVLTARVQNLYLYLAGLRHDAVQANRRVDNSIGIYICELVAETFVTEEFSIPFEELIGEDTIFVSISAIMVVVVLAVMASTAQTNAASWYTWGGNAAQLSGR